MSFENNSLAADLILGISGGLPMATSEERGCISVGSNLSITNEGVLSVPPASSSSAGVVTIGTSAGNCPVLDSNGRLPLSVMPPKTIGGEYLGEAAGQADMIALSQATVGDFCKRTDTGTYWMLGVDGASDVSHWFEYAGAVTSVNGQIGAVTIATYTLPIAQNGVLGGVQVAGRFSTSNTGVLNYEDRSPCVDYDEQAGSTITLDLNCNTYISEITANTAFNFVATALEGMSGFQFYRFELIVKTGATLYSVTFPNTITWVTDAPAFTSTNHCWRIVFESADYGQTWIASLNADYDVSEDE